MNYQQILQQIKQNSTTEYKLFNEKIANSKVQTIGAKVPYLRTLSKKLTIDDVISLPVHEYFEIDMLKGMVVVGAKLPFEQKVPYLDTFVNTVENWAVCDSNTLKINKVEKELYYDYFCKLATSKSEFVCRYGIVNLMDNYLDDQHVDGILQLLGEVTYGKYYVDMAVAWLLATAFAKCRDKTFDYLCGDAKKVLPVFCYNKALQKMRESFRISQQDKEWCKSNKI